ncbi:MAG: HAMP domain-containing histidine kinase [Saprospiraceae bacterium]|nr:HAMP domain-containing histidine kinase [Saprospiraceae bacterium]
MNNSTIIRLVVFGCLAIIGILAMQSYWVINTWNVKEQEFHDRVNVALYNVAKNFEQIGNQVPEFDVLNQVSSNYYVVNVNDVINANSLELFLRRELEAVGLTEDFEYGIYDCGTNKMVYGEYINYTFRSDSVATLQTDLPIYDKYTYYFGVRFPKRTSQILSTMSVTITFSIILFVTILFFLYSMFVILRQKRLSEMQKDFINNMTHEFKTPISTIKISADVFLRDETIQQSPRLIQYANIISDQNKRLNNQVEKVLQIAHIEHENFDLKLEPLDLHQLIKDTLESTRLKVIEQGGTLESDLQAKSPIILADQVHFGNVLYNLLDNAIKYCREKPHILVSTKEEPNGTVCLSVQDQGIGIPLELQQKIFRKFYRVPTGNLHNVKGFGLGLFYFKQIARAHGWKIHLDSSPNQGTRVQILLPQIKSKKSRHTLFGNRAAGL